MSSVTLTPDEAEEIFDLIDKDGTGSISKHTLIECCTAAHISWPKTHDALKMGGKYKVKKAEVLQAVAEGKLNFIAEADVHQRHARNQRKSEPWAVSHVTSSGVAHGRKAPRSKPGGRPGGRGAGGRPGGRRGAARKLLGEPMAVAIVSGGVAHEGAAPTPASASGGGDLLSSVTSALANAFSSPAHLLSFAEDYGPQAYKFATDNRVHLALGTTLTNDTGDDLWVFGNDGKPTKIADGDFFLAEGIPFGTYAMLSKPRSEGALATLAGGGNRASWWLKHQPSVALSNVARDMLIDPGTKELDGQTKMDVQHLAGLMKKVNTAAWDFLGKELDHPVMIRPDHRAVLTEAKLKVLEHAQAERRPQVHAKNDDPAWWIQYRKKLQKVPADHVFWDRHKDELGNYFWVENNANFKNRMDLTWWAYDLTANDGDGKNCFRAAWNPNKSQLLVKAVWTSTGRMVEEVVKSVTEAIPDDLLPHIRFHINTGSHGNADGEVASRKDALKFFEKHYEAGTLCLETLFPADRSKMFRLALTKQQREDYDEQRWETTRWETGAKAEYSSYEPCFVEEDFMSSSTATAAKVSFNVLGLNQPDYPDSAFMVIDAFCYSGNSGGPTSANGATATQPEQPGAGDHGPAQSTRLERASSIEVQRNRGYARGGGRAQGQLTVGDIICALM